MIGVGGRRSADRQKGPHREARPFPGKYIQITSFRRDGTGVDTPVWFVQENGRLLVQTDGGSYKVKRIRRNPSVLVAPCNAFGRLRAEPVAARAEVLAGPEAGQAERLLRRKYRADLAVIMPIRSLQGVLHIGRPHRKQVILAITPAAPAGGSADR